MKNKDKRPFSKDILIINDIEAVYNKIINDLQNSCSSAVEPDGWRNWHIRGYRFICLQWPSQQKRWELKIF